MQENNCPNQSYFLHVGFSASKSLSIYRRQYEECRADEVLFLLTFFNREKIKAERVRKDAGSIHLLAFISRRQSLR